MSHSLSPYRAPAPDEDAELASLANLETALRCAAAAHRRRVATLFSAFAGLGLAAFLTMFGENEAHAMHLRTDPAVLVSRVADDADLDFATRPAATNAPAEPEIALPDDER